MRSFGKKRFKRRSFKRMKRRGGGPSMGRNIFNARIGTRM